MPEFAWRPILWIVGILVILHIAVINQYGIFRDELYYLACSDRLAWGYVDHPPLCVFVVKLFTSFFGENLIAIRTPTILASAGTAILYAQVARRLGGGKLAQILACLAVAGAGVYRVIAHLYSMNGLDVLLWAAAVFLWIRIAQDKKPRLYLWLGVILGLALLTKLSALWLVLGLLGATLFTGRRADFKSWEPYACAVVAALIFAPHIAWQVQNDWITLEFLRNATIKKMIPLPAWEFFGVQIVVTNPALSIMWMLGIFYAWKRPEWRGYALGFSLVLATLLVSERSRENYLSPAYVYVSPIGAIVLANWLEKSKTRTRGYFAFAGAWIAFTFSLGMPILPPPLYIKWVEMMPLQPPAAERGLKSPMQGFADMFGWREMAQSAQSVWESLPPDERNNTPILGMNYGEAAALEQFCRGPRVIGLHNNFWLWGPGEWDGSSLILVGDIPDSIKDDFESFGIVDRLDNPHAVPEEAHAPIAMARGLKIPVMEFWQKHRHIE
ncbi:MAG: glycosyltransferase family 39 protein [Armatimonadetes bacterium]|nr:glycosyltransferase family 39 protein [Armatimonadota bacterium]